MAQGKEDDANGGAAVDAADVRQRPAPAQLEMQEQQQQQQLPFADMSLRQKVKYVSDNVTVEPITLLYIIPSLLSSTTTYNLNVEKACRVNFNYTADLCDSFSARNFTNETMPLFINVSKAVAEMQVWQSPLQSVLPIVMVLFAGSYSDRRHRRKPFILLPLAGDLLMVIGLLLCSVFYLSWPLEAAGVIEAVFPAMSGGMTVLFLAVFSYVADVTTAENRTFRIGMVATAVAWGCPAAIALSGIAFRSLGFVGVYILDIVLYSLGLAYGWVYIREPRPPVPRPEGVSFLADFCSWRHVWKTVKLGVRRRAGTRRLQFFLVILLYVTIQGPIQGEAVVSFLYVTTRYQWDEIQWSAYGTYSILIAAVGNFVVTTILSRWLNLNDCIIGMIAMAAKTLSAPGYAWAATSWQLYGVTASDILGSGAVITMRAIATKLVDADELGKMMALLAVVEAIIPLVFRPVYSKVYSEIVGGDNSGAFFHISGVVSLIGMGLYLAIYLLQRRQALLEASNSKKDDDFGGVANSAFQAGDEGRVKAAGATNGANGANGVPVENTFL